MKASRIIHMRAPLILRRFIGKKEVCPQFVGDHIGLKGGATVLLSFDTEDRDKIEVRVAWCRWSDSYCRKLGIKVAKEEMGLDGVSTLAGLNDYLQRIEDEMLQNLHCNLRGDGGENEVERKQLIRDWSHITRSITPKPKLVKPVVQQGQEFA